MVTPFDERGQLDLDAAATLAGWLVDNGSDGLVLAGTTGESPTLSDSEEVALTKAVREAVSVPLLLGTGSNDTTYATTATRRAAELGVDGILAVSPYYNRPSQAGLDHYFRSIAGATDLPVVIYDIPVRTGRKVNTATMLRLIHEVPNIVALKDAAGNPAETARFLRDAPDGFEVYSGDDALTLPLLAVGAVGVISVASHWIGRQMGEMIDAFGKGDVASATRINQSLIESYEFESGEETPNPVPTKAVLRVLGIPVGQCRPPMGFEPDWLEPRAREILAALS
jgi:4-hydroxy-tetrahydrodipicolinate synthase